MQPIITGGDGITIQRWGPDSSTPPIQSAIWPIGLVEMKLPGFIFPDPSSFLPWTLVSGSIFSQRPDTSSGLGIEEMALVCVSLWEEKKALSSHRLKGRQP
jgi:hypothetical protein